MLFCITHGTILNSPTQLRSKNILNLELYKINFVNKYGSRA